MITHASVHASIWYRPLRTFDQPELVQERIPSRQTIHINPNDLAAPTFCNAKPSTEIHGILGMRPTAASDIENN
jgi:hypothetical protein